MKTKVEKSRERLFLILMFFTFSIIGWLWEGIYDLLRFGVLANHGVLFGPWLPIYGFGGVAMYLILNRYRKYPIVVFMGSFVFCTLIEYFTGVYLEYTKGRTWWTYSDMPFNIDGKICLLASLFFGIAGYLLIYLIEPRLRNIYSKLNYKRAAILIVFLMAIFTLDFIHSIDHPNIVKRYHVLNPPIREIKLFKKK